MYLKMTPTSLYLLTTGTYVGDLTKETNKTKETKKGTGVHKNSIRTRVVMSQLLVSL